MLTRRTEFDSNRLLKIEHSESVVEFDRRHGLDWMVLDGRQLSSKTRWER
jgi:hypothetical protein